MWEFQTIFNYQNDFVWIIWLLTKLCYIVQANKAAIRVGGNGVQVKALPLEEINVAAK